MEVRASAHISFALRALLLVTISLLGCPRALGQAGYTAQVRGTVTDQTGAVVQNAKLTMTNDGTAISNSATTDNNGQYVFNGCSLYMLCGRCSRSQASLLILLPSTW